MSDLPLEQYDWPAGPPNRFHAWRDENGRVHEDVPKCLAWTHPRNSWSKRGGECRRKGVVRRGMYGDREAWFCLQHDPAREDEKRVAAGSSALRDLLAEALELMPRTKRAAAWRARAQSLLETTEAGHGRSRAH